MKLFSPSQFNLKSNSFLFCCVLTWAIGVSGNQAQAQGYCIPVYTNNCGIGGYINNFSFNTLNKQNSGCNGNTNNYILDLSVSTTVEKGGAYALSMQAGSQYAQGFGVWIDYNQDGDFADANEFVYESPTISTSLYSTYIAIPTNASSGLTRLRVRCKYAAKMLSSDFCSTFSYGETEDYNITITQPPNCINPPIAGTAIASTNFLCDPTIPFALTLNNCPNGNGQTYQWQKSGNGSTWTDIFGANTKAITQTISQSTYFRCVVTCSGSTVSGSVLVSVSTPFTLNFNASDVSCYGLNDGSVTAIVTGGTSPYSYAWSVGGSPIGPPMTYPNAPTIDSVYANSFNVTITDAKGCTTTGSYWLNQPPSIYLQKDTGSSSCGLSTGWASVTVFGGTLPYTYLWQGGQTNNMISSLPAGIYPITVTDGNNCTASTSVAVSDLGAPSLTYTISSVSCHGGNNASITVNASGGIPPFSYLWSTTPQQTTASATGLSAGTFFVTLTNPSGCKYIGTTTVFQPNQLYSGASTIPATCPGTCNGSISTNVQGGTWPYSYLWSNGDTLFNTDSLCAGNYSLTITDGNGCTLAETHPVTQPLPVSANTSQKNISCFGGQNGMISVIPSGGKPPYSFDWSPLNIVGDTAFSLLPGTYSVIVSDSDTCGSADTAFVTVTQPSVLTASITTTAASCHGTCTGSATAIASGGTSPYTYVWASVGQATQTATALCATDQIVLITDSNGCTLYDTVLVGEPLPVPITITTTPTSCGLLNGTAVASVSGSGAIPPYSYLWTTGSTSFSISGLDAGIYRANVTDGNGCFGFADAMVSSTNGPVITTVTVSPVSCFGLSNGTIDISVTGGGTPYKYLWSNGQTTQDASGLSYGPYEVKVTDATGCVSVKSIFVNAPAAISHTYSVINSGCSASNGSASIMINGGTSPYSYMWSSGGSTSAKSNLSAGLYEIVITDAKGCMDSLLIAVQDSGGPAVLVDTIAPVNCGGNGYVLIAPLDSASIFSYLWSTGNTTQNLTNASPGNYGVTVTDTNGCKSVLITPVLPVLPPVKPICLVTVDTLTGHNIVVWEKPISAFIAGFNIYRESSQQGIYQKIAYSPYSALSTYYDSIADPDIKWARYRISMVDICGKEGIVSSDHKTIHLAIHSSTASSTTLIWDAYEGYPFSYYSIYRKDSSNAIWNLIAAMPAGFTSYTDATFPLTGDTIFYHVDVDHAGGDCIATIKNPTPMATTVKSSKSNSSDRTTLPASAVTEIGDHTWMTVFPNPNNGTFTVSSNKYAVLNICIFNMLGEIIYDQNINAKKAEVIVPALTNGIYQLKIITSSAIINRKVVISR